MDKFLSSEPWWAGLSNVRMSLEIALAISEMSGRFFIIPPAIYLDGLCHWKNKKEYYDFFSIYDENIFRTTFKCVDYAEIYDEKTIAGTTYFSNVHKAATIMIYNSQYKELFPLESCINYLTINDIDSIEDIDDFKKFASGRQIFDIHCNDSIIHFPRNLFGHFYYCVYAPISKRNEIKKKILTGIQFKKAYYDEILHIVKELGEFNAIHVRRGDFLRTRPIMSERFPDIPKYLKNNLINRDLPLYIATNESDKSIFNFLRNEYNILFLDDYKTNINPLEAAIFDQLIPSYAEQFLGSGMSTYSDYINVNRAYLNKPVNTRIGCNYNKKQISYSRFPWEAEKYGWDNLYSYYWELEQDNSR